MTIGPWGLRRAWRGLASKEAQPEQHQYRVM